MEATPALKELARCAHSNRLAFAGGRLEQLFMGLEYDWEQIGDCRSAFDATDALTQATMAKDDVEASQQIVKRLADEYAASLGSDAKPDFAAVLKKFLVFVKPDCRVLVIDCNTRTSTGEIDRAAATRMITSLALYVAPCDVAPPPMDFKQIAELLQQGVLPVVLVRGNVYVLLRRDAGERRRFSLQPGVARAPPRPSPRPAERPRSATFKSTTARSRALLKRLNALQSRAMSW